MTQVNELKTQKYERFKQLFAIARQRYLDAGGDPTRSSGSLHDNDYLTDEERQELFALGSQLSGDRIINGYIHSLGRTWKLPDNSPLLNQDEVTEA